MALDEQRRFQIVLNAAYRAEVDGLRAIAVLSVVLFHMEPALLPGGFTGVDIFFVISGFLITNIIYLEMKSDQFSLSNFYARRIRRIFPALSAVLLSCLIVGWFILLPNEYAQLGEHALAGAAFFSNFRLLGEVGYFDNSADLKPLLHLWSLAVEEQYYIIWPMLLGLLFGRRLLLPGALFMLTGSFALCVVLTSWEQTTAFYFPLSRFWELLVGGSLALYLAKSRPSSHFLKSQRFMELAGFAGLALCIFGFLFITSKVSFPGFWAIVPTLGALLVILAGQGSVSNRILLSNKLVVAVGLISYPLYLWHWPLLSFVRIIEGTFREASLQSRFAAVCLSLALAYLTYAYVEKPLRFGSSRARKTVFLVIAVMAIASTGAVISKTNGIPSRISMTPARGTVLTEEYPHPQKNEYCETRYPEYKKGFSCLLSKPESAEVLIFGDSHAHQYYRSLANFLDEKSVLNLSRPSCLPFSSSRKKCHPEDVKIKKFLDDNSSIKEVYLTGYFSYLAAGRFKFGNFEGRRVAGSLGLLEKLAFQEAATSMLEYLTKRGLRITVIVDIPDVIVRPVSCLRTSSTVMNLLRFSSGSQDLSPTACFIDQFQFEKRIAPYDEALSEVLKKFPHVSVFDPRPLFCDGKKCWIIRNGVPLYWNSDHLTIEGSDMVIRALLANSGK